MKKKRDFSIRVHNFQYHFHTFPMIAAGCAYWPLDNMCWSNSNNFHHLFLSMLASYAFRLPFAALSLSLFLCPHFSFISLSNSKCETIEKLHDIVYQTETMMQYNVLLRKSEQLNWARAECEWQKSTVKNENLPIKPRNEEREHHRNGSGSCSNVSAGRIRGKTECHSWKQKPFKSNL